MELFHIFSAILAISAFFAYVNQRFIKLPSAIALLLAGLLISLVVQVWGAVSPAFELMVEARLREIDFSEVLLEFMLSFLLFAGALHTDLEKLSKSKWSILVFATVGVAISTALTGTAFYFLLQAVGQPIGYIYCLLFGALISPTDPIAVLGILKKANIPKSLEVSITGESLFNDGVGVVVFLSLFTDSPTRARQRRGVVYCRTVLVRGWRRHWVGTAHRVCCLLLYEADRPLPDRGADIAGRSNRRL